MNPSEDESSFAHEAYSEAYKRLQEWHRTVELSTSNDSWPWSHPIMDNLSDRLDVGDAYRAHALGVAL